MSVSLRLGDEARLAFERARVDEGVAKLVGYCEQIGARRLDDLSANDCRQMIESLQELTRDLAGRYHRLQSSEGT